MIEVIGSSSKGNCYFLKTKDEILIIEAGVSISEIKKKLDYNFKNVKGVLISHKHSDHARSLISLSQDYSLTCLIDLSLLEETTLKMANRCRKINSKRLVQVQPGDRKALGGFKIKVLKAYHTNDNGSPCECNSFLINHKELGTIFFATDTYYIPKLKGIDHIMVECNYSESLIDEEEGLLENDIRRIKSHMSLENLVQLLKGCDLSATKDITLLHLSLDRSDEELFVTTIENEFNIKTYIAKPGLKII